MFVKRVTLKNFKSFPDAAVQFEKGVSSIVGPNGSGKSNIVDSLLFAFGENKLKSMRVKRSTDLIFKDHNIAEVAVVLEDEKTGEKHEIRRMIRRDGKTKYKLDGKRVKKYVLEDFLAGRALFLNNIIKQGEVQRIVEMNSKERRGLIDAVANISEYEEKKNEAMDKLSDVEQNLREASAILGTREGFLKELEKEKHDAEKYVALKKDETSLKATLLAIDAAQLEKEFDEVIAEASRVNLALADVNKKIAVLEGEIAEKQAAKDKVNQEIMSRGEGKQITLQKEIDELEALIDRSKLIREEKEKELSRVDERLNNLSLELQRATDEVKGYSSRMKESSEEIQTLEDQFKREKEAYDRVFKAENDFSKNFYTAREVYEKCNEEIMACKERLNALQAEVGKNREVSRLKQNELDRLKSGAFEDFEDRRNDVSSRKTALERKLRDVEKELEDLAAKRADLDQRNAVMEDLILASREKIAELSSRIATLRESDSSRAIEALKGLKDRRIYGSLEELCSYEARHALPVQVALGSRLQNVVVEDVATAGRAIEFLKEQKMGRLSFIPLDKIKTRDLVGKAEFKHSRGAVDFVIDLLDYDKKFSKAFEFACGDTLLVESLKAAEPLVNKVRLVTQEGELAETSGLLTGGSVSKKVSTVIAKKELEEWHLKLDANAKEKESLSKKIQVLREQDFALRKEKSEAELSMRACDIELKAIEEREAKTSEARSNVTKTIAALKDEVKQAFKAIEEGEAERAELIRRLSDINVRMLEAKTAIDLEKEKTLGNAVRERERKISDLNIRLAGEKSNLESLQTQHSVYAKQTEALAKERKALEEQAKEAKGSLQEANHKATEAKKTLEQKQKEQRAISGALSDLFAKMEALDKEISKLGNEKGRLEFERERSERSMQEREIRRVTYETKLSGIRAELDAPIDASIAAVLAISVTAQAEGGAVLMPPAKLSQFVMKGKLGQEAKPEVMAKLNETSGEIARLGSINLRAIELYAQRTKEFEEQRTRVSQLVNEKAAVITMINEIEGRKTSTFMEVFNAINDNFVKVFTQIFKGQGKLILENPEKPFEGGLTIQVQLENREIKYLEIMSGGEKSLIALLFLFAMQAYNPSSIYILDEADAALDAENSRKLGLLLRELAKQSQFIVVTHNEDIFKIADCLVGVAMGKGGGSTLVEVKLHGLLASETASASAAPAAPSAPAAAGQAAEDKSQLLVTPK
jgi:chromosome segregation protein